MKFMSILLREGRKEDLKKKYSDKFDEETLDWILNISDLEDFNHKYTDFVLKNIDPKTQDVAWWVEETIDELKLFDKYQSQLPKKDINQYKSFYELQDSVRPLLMKEKEKELEKQSEKIYEDDKFLVIKPKTEEASCKYGSNTKWCVTSRGSGHFERYTKGFQQLYFIIYKPKSTDREFSKIAIHIDSEGKKNYWDAQDNRMSNRESRMFELSSPELIHAVDEDFKNYTLPQQEGFLIKTFDNYSAYGIEKPFYLGSEYTLRVNVEGFENVHELGFGHAVGKTIISLSKGDKYALLDAYELFITFSLKNENFFSFDVGFQGSDLGDQPYVVDLNLEGWGIEVSSYKYQATPEQQAELMRRYLVGKIYDQIQNYPQVRERAIGNKKVWKSIHGYTFGKNKGLIKKLVDWLEMGKIGTKLDFLVDIGKLDQTMIDGQKHYSQKGRGEFLPSVNWRGHFASFFASAKTAGILDYRKVGNQFLLIKGPNFDSFLKGEIKAL